MPEPKNFSQTVTPKDPQLGVEFGVGPLVPQSSYADWIGANNEGHVIANAHQLVPLDELIIMRRKDGQARALMRLFTLPIKLAFSKGEWVESEFLEGQGEKEAEFANQMWTLPPYAGGMQVPAQKVISQMLLALSDGFAVHEEVRMVPKEGPLKGKITLESLAYRDPRTIRFTTDSKGKLTGVKQAVATGARAEEVFIPSNKMIYYSCQEEENPYYGVSLLEAAWHHYDVKRKLYYISYIASQFAAVPGRLGKVPRNPDPVTLGQFQSALRDFAFNTAMTFPEGYEVNPFNGNGGFDFLAHINHQNLMMSQSLLASFLNQDNRQVLIDNGKADASSDMFVMSIQSIISDLEATLSYMLMPKYIHWNFKSAASPQFKFAQLSDSARDAVKEVFQSIITSSVLNCTPEFVRETERKLAKRLGYDIDYEEIERKEEENRKANEAAQEEFESAQAPPEGEPGAPAGATAPPPAQRAAPEMQATPGQVAAPQVAASMLYGIDDLVELANALHTSIVEQDS